MKKILTTILESEAEYNLYLSSLLNSYYTLLEIQQYKLNKSDIKQKILDCQKEIDIFWDTLVEKYNIPLYLDKIMKVDSNNNSVYVII